MADKYKVTIGLAITKEGGSLNFLTLALCITTCRMTRW